MTMPSTEAQASLIPKAYESAGLDYATTTYFEAHGTVTPIGDPIEFNAIIQTLNSKGRDVPLKVGSIKSNLVHLEGAAGLAGLIKAILGLEKGLIPPLSNFGSPNAKLNLQDPKLQLATELVKGPQNVPDGIRPASVNSFGAGGSNAHVVIDDAHSYLTSRGARGNHQTTVFLPKAKVDSAHGSSESSEGDLESADGRNTTSKLLVFSAPEQAALQRMAPSYTAYLMLKQAKRHLHRHPRIHSIFINLPIRSPLVAASGTSDHMLLQPRRRSSSH
jgi:acyl transferase domain-containing protein